jgi:hypothetical protein
MDNLTTSSKGKDEAPLFVGKKDEACEPSSNQEASTEAQSNGTKEHTRSIGEKQNCGDNDAPQLDAMKDEAGGEKNVDPQLPVDTDVPVVGEVPTKHEEVEKKGNAAADTKGEGDKKNLDELQDEAPKTFPQVLMDIMSNEEDSDTISWLPHGRSFIIYKKKRFGSAVLPKYFKATKFTSFTRKLNRWGFTRVTRGPEMGSYYHKLFLRDDPSLCLRMSSHNSGKFQEQQQLMPNPMAGGMPFGTMPFGYPGMMPMMNMPHQMNPAEISQQNQLITQQLQQLQWQQFQLQQLQQQHQHAASMTGQGGPGGHHAHQIPQQHQQNHPHPGQGPSGGPANYWQGSTGPSNFAGPPPHHQGQLPGQQAPAPDHGPPQPAGQNQGLTSVMPAHQSHHQGSMPSPHQGPHDMQSTNQQGPPGPPPQAHQVHVAGVPQGE